MYQVKVDDEVWERLKRLAIPFEDHEPNDVLRRVLGLKRSEQAKHVQNIETRLTRKGLGKLRREEYISELEHQGLSVKLVNSVWGSLADGSWVAIPFAQEWRRDRWFLGLPEKDLREKGRVFIVLLCQYPSGSTFDIVIPPDVVTSLVGRLSKSKGQVKFNLRKLRNRYLLVIPSSEPLDVSDYLRSRSLLGKKS